MKTAEEVWDEMGDLVIPTVHSGKIERVAYDRANLAILLRWQAEILEAAMWECELEKRSQDSSDDGDVRFGCDRCAERISKLKPEAT